MWKQVRAFYAKIVAFITKITLILTSLKWIISQSIRLKLAAKSVVHANETMAAAR